MHITERQAAAIERAGADVFDRRALAFLKSRHPALAARHDDERFLRFIEHGRARAPAHGFASEREIVTYLLLMMRLGPRFDEDPRFETLLPLLDPASPMPAAWRLNTLVRAARRHPDPEADDGH